MSNEVRNIYGAYEVSAALNRPSIPVRYGKQETAEGKKDMVAISSPAKDFQSVMQALSAVPDVRTEKVASIKAKIEAGTYNISTELVSEKMLAKFFMV